MWFADILFGYRPLFDYRPEVRAAASPSGNPRAAT